MLPRGAARAPTARRRSASSTRRRAAANTVGQRSGDHRHPGSRRGISADDLAHIFDPYFTTRRAGTGLGLPIAKNIIEGLGGSVTVSSRRGPRHRDPDRPAAAPPARTSRHDVPAGTILLADDEEKILKRWAGRCATRARGRRSHEHPRGAAVPRRTLVRPARRRQPDAGHDRARADSRAVADDGGSRTAADRHDDRARLHADRARGVQARRRGLPREAVRGRRAARAGASRGQEPAAADPAPAT